LGGKKEQLECRTSLLGRSLFLARLLTDLRLEDKRFFINAKLEREKRQRLISLPHFSGRFEAKEGMFRGERVLRRAFLLGEKAQEALVLTLSEIFLSRARSNPRWAQQFLFHSFQAHHSLCNRAAFFSRLSPANFGFILFDQCEIIRAKRGG
jgi:hypothetical protein